MVETQSQRPLLRVVPDAELQERLDAEEARRASEGQGVSDTAMDDLASFIRTRYEIFRNHRGNGEAGWNHRLLAALRTFNGTYDPEKLSEIRKFGGSEIYARIIAMKCRGASSLLRDVYLTADRPWGIAPPADPDVPAEIVATIQQLVQAELQTMGASGQGVDPGAIRDRVNQLMEAARQAEKKQAGKRAKVAEDKIEEILVTGGFYKALAQFLVDIPLFPFACIKGPVVKIVPTVDWSSGQAQIVNKPRLFWTRVSPFDLYWTPGAADIEDAEVIERSQVTRSDLNDLLDLPGYNTENIEKILDEYGRGGLAEDWDSPDTERAVQENRENPRFNRSGTISCLEFHGNVQGRQLHEFGFGEDIIPDAVRDYMVQAWVIGRYVIKVQLSPSPRKRHPYFITSFEKVPGTPVGNGLPDILSDIQDTCNATLRALINNLSIASGPQVVVNDDRISPGQDGENLYPWKRWHVTSDPMANNTQMPISFFQPNSHAQELLSVYREFNNIADELSAIPKYLSGQGATGGAGRTAAGLAMLMGNASKILQTVAANVDRDVIDPALSQLFDMVMLTDSTGILKGDEAVRVMGVNVAIQRETQRARQLEFLTITANPVDTQIMGTKGRGAVLRSVSQTIGLDGEAIVPSDDQLEAMAAEQAQLAQAGAQAQGSQPGETSTKDMGPRVKVGGGVG